MRISRPSIESPILKNLPGYFPQRSLISKQWLGPGGAGSVIIDCGYAFPWYSPWESFMFIACRGADKSQVLALISLPVPHNRSIY